MPAGTPQSARARSHTGTSRQTRGSFTAHSGAAANSSWMNCVIAARASRAAADARQQALVDFESLLIFPEALLVVPGCGRHESGAQFDAEKVQHAGGGGRPAPMHAEHQDGAGGLSSHRIHRATPIIRL